MVENSFGLMEMKYSMIPSMNKNKITEEEFEKTPYELKVHMIRNITNGEWRLRKKVFCELMNFLMINIELHGKDYPPHIQILNQNEDEDNIVVGSVIDEITENEYDHGIEVSFGVNSERGWRQPLWDTENIIRTIYLYCRDENTFTVKKTKIERECIVLEDLIDGLIQLKHSLSSYTDENDDEENSVKTNIMRELTKFECYKVNYESGELHFRCKFSF
jgi:hypothetical protein